MEQVIRILIEHTFGREEARRKIDDWTEKIQGEALPAGVELSDLHECWSDNVLEFSFRLHKRFLSVTIMGLATINDRDIILDLDLPDVVQAFVPRRMIQERLENSLRMALVPSAGNGGSLQLCN